MAKRLILESKMDSAAAERLRNNLVDAQSKDVILDGSQVDMLGGLSLEVLLSTRHLWEASGKGFTLENPSTEMVENLGWFGLTLTDFKGGVA